MSVYWLIDGTYMYKCAKSLGLDLDYRKLREKIEKEICNNENLVAYFFNTSSEDNSDLPFFNWLQSSKPNGPQIRIKKYVIKQKTYKCNSCNTDISIQVQKGVDIGIITTAYKFIDEYQTLVLSLGDGDFKDAIEFLVEIKKKNVVIMAFNGVSTDLQPYCDKIFYINEFIDEVKDNRST